MAKVKLQTFKVQLEDFYELVFKNIGHKKVIYLLLSFISRCTYQYSSTSTAMNHQNFYKIHMVSYLIEYVHEQIAIFGCFPTF